jgi:hypothetical protein
MGRPPKPSTTDDPFDAEKAEPKKASPVSVEEFAKILDSEEEGGFLDIPRNLWPPGMRYEWKTLSVFGQQQSRRFGRFQSKGWEPVPASRHPGLFHPVGHEGYIEYDGLVLCERPEEMCQMVEEREHQKATGQVRGKEAQLFGGDVDGIGFDTKHRSARRVSGVKKSYEPFVVPRDDE